MLYGASLIPNLKELTLANQSFSGTLPSNNIVMPVLEVMNLNSNLIQVSFTSLHSDGLSRGFMWLSKRGMTKYGSLYCPGGEGCIAAFTHTLKPACTWKFALVVKTTS